MNNFKKQFQFALFMITIMTIIMGCSSGEGKSSTITLTTEEVQRLEAVNGSNSFSF